MDSSSPPDWVSAHLAWINRTPSFVPKNAADFNGNSYFSVMSELYKVQSKFPGLQKYAKMTYEEDVLWSDECIKIHECVLKSKYDLKKTEPFKYFMTIGFNHQTWTIPKCVKAINNIIDLEWVIRVKANFELYRENGEHPHCHFYFTSFRTKKDILERLSRPKYITDVVLSKNFIDIKPAALYHLDYIMLDKTSSKLSYVAKDKEWREKNDIADFQKNWIV